MKPEPTDGEYVCETWRDSEDVEKIAAHFHLNPDALRAARDAQGAMSALGIASPIVAYLKADQPPGGTP